MFFRPPFRRAVPRWVQDPSRGVGLNPDFDRLVRCMAPLRLAKQGLSPKDIVFSMQ